MTSIKEQMAELRKDTDRSTRKHAREVARLTEQRRKEKLRARLTEIRAMIKAANEQRRERTKAIKQGARDALRHVRQRTVDLRRHLSEASKAAAELSKFIAPGARVHLSARQSAALQGLASSHGALVHTLSTEARDALAKEKALREDRAEVRSAKSYGKRWKEKPLSSARERREEDDDAVRGNLPRELLPAFEKMKGKIKGSAHRSRTEAFLEWATDHAGDAARYAETAAEDISDLIEEEKQLAAEMRKPRKRG